MNNRKTVNPNERYYFEKEGDNLILIQRDQWGNHNFLAEKITVLPITDQWQKRMGQYTTDGINKYQMFSDFKLTLENGLLLLKCKFNMEFSSGEDLVIPLKIMNDKLAVVYGYGRFSGQAIQFVTDKNGKELMKFMGFNCALEK